MRKEQLHESFQTILTLIGCLLIALGIYSAATFLMERDFASPSANQTVSKPEQEEVQQEPEEPVEEEPEEEELSRPRTRSRQPGLPARRKSLPI